ncbi:hypothetical protein ACHQM5_004068 [Ranunculus cassubicifolius]
MKLEPSCLSALDELLHDIYIAGRPSSDNCSLRRELVRTFHVMAREVFGCHDGFPVVEAYGSFIMDIFSNNSDLDLSVNFSNDPAGLPQNEKVKALRKFMKKLFQLQNKGRLCGVEPILTAKVPILRAVDCQTGIECDISVENKDSILKSQFVLIVSEIDERFQKLSSLMKTWAKANDINSSKDRTLNSIAIILLVAFHLQTREPPIFPPFSLLLKDGIEPENVKKVVQEYLQYGKENKESVAELFVTLLSKLASVEDQWREGLCASTYEGSWISKTWDSKVGSISVEDFMDRAQNVARAVGPDQVEVIYECINDTMLHLWDFSEDRIQGDELKEVLFGADEFTTLDEYNKRSRDTELRTFTPYKMSKREKKAARKAIRKEEQAVWKEEQAMKIGNFTVTEEGKNTVDSTVTEEGKNTVDYVTEKEEKTVDPIVTGMLPRRMSKRERRIARTAKRQAKRPMQSHDSIVTEKQETMIDSVVTGKEETAAVESVGVRRRENFAMQRVKKSGTLSVPEDDTQPKRNLTVIEKIESLNQKARIRGLSPKSDDTPNEAPVIDSNSAGVEAFSFNRRDVSRPVHDPRISAINVLNSSSGMGLMQHDTQKRPHGVQGRTDDRGKGRSNHPKNDEWKKKLPVSGFSAEGSEKPNLNQGKVGLGEDSSGLDPNEHQRAKVREMVAERAKRLQKEEEERTREQRAWVQAKLDELTRWTLAETPTEKVDNPLPQTVHPQHNNKQDNSLSVTDANTPIEAMSSSASTREGCIVNPSSWDCYTVVPSGWDLDPVEDEPDHTVANKPRDDSTILKSKQHGFKKKQNVKRGDADVNHFDPTNATTDDSLLKHKKKNNSKAKTDELSSSSVHPPDKPLPPPDKIKKTSVSVFEVGSVQVPFSIEIAETAQDSVVATIDQGEHVVDSSNHHHYHNLKPPRRLPRNTQVGGGITSTVVWAPVGSGKKQPEDAKLNTSSTVEAHKSKRAEMERYVPKPKEVSVQQVNTEQTSNVLPVVENKHNNKHTGKAHGLWRPRNSGEPTAANEPVTDTGVVGGYRSGRKPGVVVSSEQETIEAASQWQPKSQSSQAEAQGTTTTTVRGNGGQQRVNKKAPRKEYYPQAELSDASHQEMFSGPRYGGGQNQRVQQQVPSKQQQRKYDAQYQYHQKAGGRSNNNGNGNEPPSLPPNESSFDHVVQVQEDKLSHGVEGILMQHGEIIILLIEINNLLSFVC